MATSDDDDAKIALIHLVGFIDRLRDNEDAATEEEALDLLYKSRELHRAREIAEDP
jgi:hypothetical protein